ncbi:hypothetical protein GCM10007895_02160 [Paraferrimonas sedimenticola]|uniref:Uncharacterized protein n=1 Tax=Paraferrimonas sedimenticola TaxID=375674 RepID=A0AA37RMJ9_9GAMM|nr:hypothetical protein GCM10007895_02160 [Paraferrimonas sedimenticola]
MLLVVALVAVLAVLSVVQQKKKQALAEKRQAIAKSKAIVDESERILECAAELALDFPTMVLLNKRYVDALSLLQKHQDEKSVANKFAQAKETLIQLEQRKVTLPTQMRLSDDDKQIVKMVQALKRLKAVVNFEHNKSNLSQEVFGLIAQSIDQKQRRINIESSLTRAASSMVIQQWGSARHLLNNVSVQIPVLYSGEDKEYAAHIDQRYNQLRAQLEQSMPDIEIEIDERDGELEQLFNKRKW